MCVAHHITIAFLIDKWPLTYTNALFGLTAIAAENAMDAVILSGIVFAAVAAQ